MYLLELRIKMNPLLIEDIFIQICYQINDVKLIMIIQEICKWHKKIIRKNKWIGLPINVKNDENIISMLKTHNFSNVRLRNVSDVSVSKLVNAHTLDLNGTKVTDVSISKLVNAHTLYLNNTKVTDESVSKLINVHTLYLYNTKVSKECVEKLKLYKCNIYE